MAHWNKDKKGSFKIGEEHPNWKGGISNEKSYEELRYTGKRKEAIQERNRKKTKEQMKNEFIKSTYGIDLEEYFRLLHEQKGVCALCGKEETRRSRYGGVCKLTIDHNHITKQVRGLLCQKCHRGLGNFREDINIFKKAELYLTKFNRRKT